MNPPGPWQPSRSRRDPAAVRRQRAALERVASVQGHAARLFAHRMDVAADLVEEFGGQVERDVVLHYAGTARMGQLAATTELRNGLRLRECFPQALQLLREGRMYVRTAEILLEVTKHASARVQQEVGRRVTGEIAQWDAADVRRRVAAVLPEVESELEGQEQQDRHARARANRGMWVLPIGDGMARIGIETDQLSAARFAAGFDELDRAQAELDRRDGVRRGAGQRRADLLTELPHRYLALLHAQQTNQVDALLADAAARNAESRRARAACALGDPGPVAEELPLGLAPAGPPRAWQLDPTELAIDLLRVPVTDEVQVYVHVPVTTLLELDERALRLDGTNTYLPAFHARRLMPTAALRRVLVDHLTGIPIAVDPVAVPPPRVPVELEAPPHYVDCEHDGCTDPAHRRALSYHRPRLQPPPSKTQRAQRQLEKARREQRRELFAMVQSCITIDTSESRHDPSATLRALVRLRDQTSRGIGCTRSAKSSDLDHRQDWAKGGLTAAWNLDAQGPRAHHSKDDGWVPVKDETTGIIRWLSPLEVAFLRQPAWDPPPTISDDAQIPPLDTQLPLEADRDRPENPDRPLWTDPRHHDNTPADPASHQPTEAPQPPRSRGWHNDGEPFPF